MSLFPYNEDCEFPDDDYLEAHAEALYEDDDWEDDEDE